ncbi:MAG: hypothetical protein R3B71_01095 [Candidatus Gracilibacteria bacterium]
MSVEHPALSLLEQELGSELSEFQELHREFSAPFSKRVNVILDSLVQDEDGDEYGVRKTKNMAAKFAARVRAILEQIRNNDQWAMGGRKGATEEGFQRSARTDFKTFQEFLSSPMVRIAYSRSRAEDASLDEIVVDPAYINDNLLDNLSLAQLKPEKGLSPSERTAHYADAIPAIKRQLASLTPLKLNNDLSSDHPRKYDRRPAIGSGLRLYYNEDGRVLVTQSPNGRGKKVLHSTNVHKAFRRIDIIREGYDKEIETLHHIKATMAAVSRKVGADWGAVKADMQAVQGQMMTCIDSLRHVSNEHKKEMKRIIVDAFDFQMDHKLQSGEVQKRYNPGAHRARFTKIPKFVNARIGEIASIRTYLEEDQVCVKTHIQEMQAPLAEFLITVEELHEHFTLLDEDKPLSDRTRSKIMKNLADIQAQCQPTEDRPILQPYRTYAEEVSYHVERTKNFLEADERNKAKDEFMNAYIVARIQDLYVHLQRFYDDHLAREAAPDLDQMLIDLEEVNARAGAKQVAPEVLTKRYNHFWGEGIYHLINGLRKEILRARDMDDPKKRHDYRGAMRERFHRVDFTEIVDCTVPAA